MRVFVAVAEELHFGRAAERLHLAQSAVSQSVRQVERELGVRLLERTSRHVQLTAAGETLLEDSRELTQLAADARRRAQRAAVGAHGRLRVAVVPSGWWGAVPRVLRELRALHPEVELQLAEQDTADQVRALLAGRLDLGFLRLETPPAGVQLGELVREPLMAALPAPHRLAAGRAGIRLRELAGESFVMFPRWVAPEYFDRLTALCLQVGGFSPRAVQECQTDHAQLGMVGVGLGVALVAEGTTRLRPPGVVFQPLRDRAATTTLAIACADPPLAPLAAEAFALVESARRREDQVSSTFPN